MDNPILRLIKTHIQHFQHNLTTSNQMWEAIVEDLDTLIHEEESPDNDDETLEVAESLYATV